MPQRIRPFGTAWMAPHALAAELTAKAGQLKGQMYANIGQGIAGGAGIIAAGRQRDEAIAREESRFQTERSDRLAREDREQQAWMAKQMVEMNLRAADEAAAAGEGELAAKLVTAAQGAWSSFQAQKSYAQQPGGGEQPCTTGKCGIRPQPAPRYGAPAGGDTWGSVVEAYRAKAGRVAAPAAATSSLLETAVALHEQSGLVESEAEAKMVEQRIGELARKAQGEKSPETTAVMQRLYDAQRKLGRRVESFKAVDAPAVTADAVTPGQREALRIRGVPTGSFLGMPLGPQTKEGGEEALRVARERATLEGRVEGQRATAALRAEEAKARAERYVNTMALEFPGVAAEYRAMLARGETPDIGAIRGRLAAERKRAVDERVDKAGAYKNDPVYAALRNSMVTAKEVADDAQYDASFDKNLIPLAQQKQQEYLDASKALDEWLMRQAAPGSVPQEELSVWQRIARGGVQTASPSAGARYPSWLPPAGRADWDALSPSAKQEVLRVRGN